MKTKNFNFIKVSKSDTNTIKMLKSENVPFACESGDFLLFINSGKVNFSDEDKKNIEYTNVIYT